MEKARTVAIIGDTPEALFLSILYAEAGIPNYLVGPFGEEGRAYANRSGVEEALWLLGILTRSGKIKLAADHRQVPISQIRTLIFAIHASNHGNTNNLEMTIRNLASGLAPGTSVAYAGLCSPHFTSSLLKSTIERISGLKSGTDLGFHYVPLFWNGERLQEFKEKPQVLASLQPLDSQAFQEEFLRVFPCLSMAPSVEVAEASGLFTAVNHEIGRALTLELAGISERTGVNYAEVLELCKTTKLGLIGRSMSPPGRESIGTEIVLSHSLRRSGPRLARAAHSINQEYQSQLVDMIKGALNHCGYPFRRSRVAILGTDGLLRNSWSKLETPPIIQSLEKKGAMVSLYTGENGSEPWSRIVGGHARIENTLLGAVAKANCTVVALPKQRVSELDPDQLATQMNRPGAICDLTGVLEASNVERAGLFYTAIGRGALDG